ncbi:hypothetical protein Adt_39545 [Abeliophyllum distichum]|uniref:Uncharacterized protein n=1 Tax=Abeliophyllum distichum TaxID=126358 RepID=A0ABD1Q5D1_9LAMI
MEKNVIYTEGLFKNCQSQRQNANEDDDLEHPIIHQSKLMITVQESLVGNDSSSKLKKKKIRHSESNEKILKRLAEIEVKLQSNEEILNRLVEIEVKVESNDIILKRLTNIELKIQSNEEIQNRLAELEMKVQSNIRTEKQIKELEDKVKSNEEILERVEIVESKTDCASSSKTCEIDVNDDEIELKDENWQKIDEIAAATDDEFTLDAHLKRQKKPATLLLSPWVNQYDSAVGTSTVGTTKHVVKGTYAIKIGLCSPCGSDMEAFESWYKQGLVTKNGDYGIYVIKYAKYFINEMLKEMPKTFNIAQVRKHLATQLYVYAKKKQVENYDTDND